MSRVALRYTRKPRRVDCYTGVLEGLNWKTSLIDRFTDTAAILISIISNSYYGMLRGKLICICSLSIP